MRKSRERRKPRNTRFQFMIKYGLITILILFVAVVISTLVNYFLINAINLPHEEAMMTTNLVEGILAAVAAGLVLYELRQNYEEECHENDIEEAQFILKYNQAFIQDPNMAYVESMLEKHSFYDENGPMITDENRQKFINYLVYLESLAPLILRKILLLDHVDDLFAYRFFLALNNPEIQEDQLCRTEFSEYYRGCFKAYKFWAKYRKEHNREILFEETSLDKWEHFEEYAND